MNQQAQWEVGLIPNIPTDLRLITSTNLDGKRFGRMPAPRR
jgi:hypothetical protein